MARARGRDNWNHTSALLALTANCNRDPKRRSAPWTPDDFNPYTERKGRQGTRLTKDNISALAVFAKKKRTVKASEVRVNGRPGRH